MCQRRNQYERILEFPVPYLLTYVRPKCTVFLFIGPLADHDYICTLHCVKVTQLLHLAHLYDHNLPYDAPFLDVQLLHLAL